MWRIAYTVIHYFAKNVIATVTAIETFTLRKNIFLGKEERTSTPSGETQAGLCSKFKWNFLRNLRLETKFLSLNMAEWIRIYIQFSVN